MNKRKLPIGGVQTFSELRRDYDVYVDKTMHIYNMASRYKTVFLSRPRRFGKSLLCSTIASLFRADREYFDGLAIIDTDWKWEKHPVIHIDLGAGNYTENGVAVLVAMLNEQLDHVCDEYAISKQDNEIISVRFTRIIKELSAKYGQVVIIIDEYDNPLYNTLNKPELNEKLREELKGFYSVIKQSGEYIRFAFITGITKFAQISVFSGMNQPSDISMDPDYCDICGITQEELEKYFEPEIDDYAARHGGRENYLHKLREYYNGYYFTHKKLSVYNTYGLLFHFDRGADLMPFWSMSGTTSLLVKYLDKRVVDIVDIENARMRATDFADYKDNTITLFPLLYQAGYLTISDYDENTGAYSLTYPNVEIRQTLAAFLASNFSDAQVTVKNSLSVQLVEALRSGDMEDFMHVLKWYLANVDYSLSSKITEYYFEFAVSNIINMLGLVCKNETHTANGRMDSVVYAGDYIYIFEFKVDKPVEGALRQIKDKNYAQIFANCGRKLVKVGVVFSRETKNIIDWKVSE